MVRDVLFPRPPPPPNRTSGSSLVSEGARGGGDRGAKVGEAIAPGLIGQRPSERAGRRARVCPVLGPSIDLAGWRPCATRRQGGKNLASPRLVFPSTPSATMRTMSPGMLGRCLVTMRAPGSPRNDNGDGIPASHDTSPPSPASVPPSRDRRPGITKELDYWGFTTTVQTVR